MHVFDAEETGIRKDIPERIQGAAFCASLEKAFQPSCYFYVPRIFAQSESMVEEAVKMCEQMNENDMKHICAIGAGHMFTKYQLPDYEKAKKSCNLFSPDLQKFCHDGGVMYQRLQEETDISSL
jgi:hypothetical protein